MKKTIIIGFGILTILLLSTFALAQGKGSPEQIKQTSQQKEIEQQQIRNQTREQTRARLQSGLENVLALPTTNENARERIQLNMNRFQNTFQERMQRMHNAEIENFDSDTGAVQIKAEEEVKLFGLFKIRTTNRFSINERGQIQEKNQWYRFMCRAYKD